VNPEDYCPCGAPVTMQAVDQHGYTGQCEAGHELWFKTLDEPGRILEDE
jgi:hypothetical protein